MSDYLRDSILLERMVEAVEYGHKTKALFEISLGVHSFYLRAGINTYRTSGSLTYQRVLNSINNPFLPLMDHMMRGLDEMMGRRPRPDRDRADEENTKLEAFQRLYGGPPTKKPQTHPLYEEAVKMLDKGLKFISLDEVGDKLPEEDNPKL